MNKFSFSILIVLVVGGITLGNAYALMIFNDDVMVDDNGSTSLQVIADSGQANILFTDAGTRTFSFAMVDGQGTFMIGDVTAGLSRIGIDSDGNVGIGTNAPHEKLHVLGNIKLTGDIVSDGNICIGSCP
jgi:hypothetical protein